MKITAALLAAALIAVSSSAPADAWGYRRGYYAPYYRPYAQTFDPGPAIALGMFGALMGAAIASQGGYYGYPYAYYSGPAYGYMPGPCPQWWDGYMWEYSCN